MKKQSDAHPACSVCARRVHRNELISGHAIREPIVSEILREYPDWKNDGDVCFECLNRYRAEHVRRLLEEEKGELSTLEEQVIESLGEQESISSNVNVQFERELTFGERVSDRLASFGGSWTFLIIFAGVVVVWMIINTALLSQRPFDPYPFILLNLLLSCLAAIQAPVILMSQNRQEAKDRLRSEYDYRVNLKAELEIRLLHTKVDQLLIHQWQRLLEIQQLQMELMEDVAERWQKER